MARRVVVAVLLLMSLAAAQAKRPFAFEDMMKLQRLGDPAVPPTAAGSCSAPWM